MKAIKHILRIILVLAALSVIPTELKGASALSP